MTFYGTLHPYQEAARDLVLEEMRALIAYEMGLGKTPITIAAVEQLADEQQVDTGLIVALSGLKYQWQASINRFTCADCQGSLDEGERGHQHVPTATTLVIDGTPKQRAEQYELAMTGAARYVMVNYEQVVNDWPKVKRLPRDFVVCDEITAIKGFRAQRSKRVKRLTAPYRIGLTGTPMENGKLEEIFSIMQWVDEEVLGRFDIFDRVFITRNDFGGVRRYKNVPLFRKTMDRSWIVKTQSDPDVAPYLPAVIERVHFARLDAPSAKLYQSVANELIADLGDALSKGVSAFDLYSHYSGGGSDVVDALRGQIMAKMTALQMICDHPRLLKVSADRWAESMKTGKPGGSEYAWMLDQRGLLAPLLKAKTPPKMQLAMDLMGRALERERSKVVLFSHDVPTLPLLQDALPKGIAVTYDGTMSAKQKEANKRRFQTEEDVRVLLSSDAGGFGVDLPQSDVLVNYDLPWSNGALKQRNSRIIRASSTFKRVSLHHLLVQGSIDVWMYDKVGGKVAAADAFVLGRGLDAKGGLDITTEGLMQFLLANQP